MMALGFFVLFMAPALWAASSRGASYASLLARSRLPRLQFSRWWRQTNWPRQGLVHQDDILAAAEAGLKWRERLALPRGLSALYR